MEVCHQEETFGVGERQRGFRGNFDENRFVSVNLPNKDRHQRHVARGSATLISKVTFKVGNGGVWWILGGEIIQSWCNGEVLEVIIFEIQDGGT